jgi:hypothetical protein
VVGVADLDFDDELGELKSINNLIYTEHSDLIADVFNCSESTNRVLHAHCDPARLTQHLNMLKMSAHEVILQIAFPVSALRFVSRRDELRLAMRDFPVQEVVDRTTGRTDLQKLVKVASAKSGLSLDEDEVVARLQLALRAYQDDLGRRCCGHDIISVFALLLRKQWSRTNVGKDGLRRAFASAFSCQDFRATRLYARIRAWCLANGTIVWAC